jgi:hypothetical protein
VATADVAGVAPMRTMMHRALRLTRRLSTAAAAPPTEAAIPDTAPATPRPIVRIDTDDDEYEVVFSGRGFLDGRGLSQAGGDSSLAGTHQVLTRRTREARRA